MARVSLDTGSGAMLWPSGTSSVDEIPSELLEAIQHATMLISLQRNMKREDIPPAWMWPFSDEMKIWFDELDAARKNKDGGDNREQVPLQENAASDLRVK